MTAAVDELRLGLEELAELGRLLGLATPSHHLREAAPPADDADGRAVQAAVLRGLLARGLITLAPGEPPAVTVAPAVAELVALLSRPGLTSRLQVQRRPGSGDTVVHTVLALPQRAVLETDDGSGVLVYVPLEPADLLQALVDLAGIDDRPAGGTVAGPGGGTDFVTTVGALAAAGDAALAGDVEACAAALVGPGVAAEAAHGYAEALVAPGRGTRGLTTMHRADGAFTASVVAWSDCGDAGLWLVEQDDAFAVYGGPRPRELPAEVLQSPVRVRAVSGEQLLDEILAGFPGRR